MNCAGFPRGSTVIVSLGMCQVPVGWQLITGRGGVAEDLGWTRVTKAPGTFPIPHNASVVSSCHEEVEIIDRVSVAFVSEGVHAMLLLGGRFYGN